MAQRSLTLTEELERLEQQITLTLQEIDSNFSKAHRIVTSSIIPIVEEHAKHSNAVWEGSKFWKQFFEASANVSLSGYEEPAEEEVTHTETNESIQTPTQNTPGRDDDDDEITIDTELRADDDDDEFTMDSPTQVTGVHSTPRLPPSTTKQPRSTTKAQASSRSKTATAQSPAPRQYTGRKAQAASTSGTPSTPRTRSSASMLQSSPFEPESAYQPPSAFRQPQAQSKPQNTDPLLHRMLDKTYRIQATPHTERRRPAAAAAKPTPTTTAERKPWDDSPGSSPIMAAPQLRGDLFSPAKTAQRTPGVSVLTPGLGRSRIKGGILPPTTSTGRRLFSPQDKTYSATRQHARQRGSLEAYDYDEDDDYLESEGNDDSAIFDAQQLTSRYEFDDRRNDAMARDDTTTSEFGMLAGMSPPKTLQFHVPQSRLLQTPAREASRRIVDDLLLTAGADATDDIEGDTNDGFEPPSPSVVVRAGAMDDTF